MSVPDITRPETLQAGESLHLLNDRRSNARQVVYVKNAGRVVQLCLVDDRSETVTASTPALLEYLMHRQHRASFDFVDPGLRLLTASWRERLERFDFLEGSAETRKRWE